MVTAQFNEDLLTKPELTPLPGEKPDAESKPEEEKEDVEKTSAAESRLDEAAGKLALADDEGLDGNPLIDDVSQEQKESAKQTASEKKKGKSVAADTDAEKAKADDTEITKPKSPEQLERDRITKENERKQKEYDDKVKKGKEKVKELSDRFSDWYYVVSDSTYHKIHLGRDEIVKKKTPPAEDKKPDAHGHDHDEDSKDILSDEDKAPLAE